MVMPLSSLFHRTWLRWLAFLMLGIVGVFFYQQILLAGSAVSAFGTPYIVPGIGVALIAVLGVWLVLQAPLQRVPQRISRLSQHRLGSWGELGVILAVGLVFRAVFWSATPMISHDAYRYVWDAHLVAHGVSPYLHPASDPTLIPFRDAAIWPQLDWPHSPTIYPPGAELFFLLINAIAPLNIMAMKVAMGICDLGIGVLTIVLLRQHGLDLRRVIIYWWNPIPIIEFFYNAHVDAVAVLWTVLAVVLSLQHWRGARTLAGIALGLAVLTKLYPLLFVLVFIRRRDWEFLAGFIATLLVTTLPFLLLGIGSGGFLTTYFSQRFVDQGILFRLITQLTVDQRLQFVLQGAALLAFCALVFWLYQRQVVRATAGILALSVAWIVVSPHLFPWYVAGVLPFLALYLRLPAVQSSGTQPLAHSQGAWWSSYTFLLPLALWLFVLEMPFAYVVFAPGYNANLFLLFFVIPLLLTGITGSCYLFKLRRPSSNISSANAGVVAMSQVTGSHTPIVLEDE